MTLSALNEEIVLIDKKNELRKELDLVTEQLRKHQTKYPIN